MILVIDTSAREAAIATIDAEGRIWERHLASRSQDLIPELRRLAGLGPITKVAVVTGPGSFTGLRVGVSFGLGLAKGLGVPIVPLPTLELQAARSEEPVTAVVEAGRGRFYFLAPRSAVRLGEAAEIPRSHPLVGRLSGEGRAALEAAGHSLAAEEGLRTLGVAARSLLETANEVAYGSLKIDYMQSFSAKA